MNFLLKTLCVSALLATSSYANASDEVSQILGSSHFILLAIGLLGLKATRRNAKDKA